MYTPFQLMSRDELLAHTYTHIKCIIINTKQKISATAPTRPGQLSFSVPQQLPHHQLRLQLLLQHHLASAAGSSAVDATKQPPLLQFQFQFQFKFQFHVTATAAVVVVMASKGTGLHIERKELALLLPCCIAAGCSPFMTCTTTEAESVHGFSIR